MGGRQGRRWLARALGLVLLLQVLLPPAPAHALSWRLPGRTNPSAPRSADDNASRQLREVPPPAWVQKARLALEDRNPALSILAPADGDLLPDEPWTLRLRVEDWPLVDAGPLGLGPHLVVQLDGEPPRPTVDTTVAMPPLSPGSHLLTVYAAKPWGEAHKSPLALQQIRLHRLAPNPPTLPAPHSPQLLPVSPIGPAGPPPLLIDWLLIDAPLQGLRADASGWRLRLTVNGESVLLDQQTPLWLRGWKPGGNALLLELLDGRGEPLNPPFNSLLREVNMPPAGSERAGRSPADSLTDLELAVLLGERPVSDLAPVETSALEEPAVSEPPPSRSAPDSTEEPVVPASPDAALPPEPPLAGPALDDSDAPTVATPPLTDNGRSPTQDDSALSSPSAPPESGSARTATDPSAPLPSTPPVDRRDSPPTPAPLTAEAPSLDAAPSASAPLSESLPLTSPPPPARSEPNADGSLRRGSRPGPLERLREPRDR